MNNTVANHTIPAVTKAVGIVSVLGTSATPLSKTELEECLEISRSTCYRILQTLLQANWIEKTEAGRYRLSVGLLPALRSITNDARTFEPLQPLLHRLADETGLSCKLSIRRRNHQLTVLCAAAHRKIQVSGNVGAQFPIIEGSVGAALLAAETDETLLTLVANCFEEIPERTHPELLLNKVRKLRKTGWVSNPQPNRWNVHAMSAPIRDAAGQVLAALTLLGWNDDFAGKRAKALAQQLTRNAAWGARLLNNNP